MARTPGALDSTNPERIKQWEIKKEEIRRKADEDIAALDAKIDAAQEKKAKKLAEKLLKSGKTEKEINDFLSDL